MDSFVHIALFCDIDSFAIDDAFAPIVCMTSYGKPVVAMARSASDHLIVKVEVHVCKQRVCSNKNHISPYCFLCYYSKPFSV